jgi:hypothetical protein
MSLEPAKRGQTAPAEHAAAELQPMIDRAGWLERSSLRHQSFMALFQAELEDRVRQVHYENHAELTETIASHFAQFNRELKDANVQLGKELYEAMIKNDNPFTEAAIKRQWEVWVDETARLLASMAREE